MNPRVLSILQISKQYVSIFSFSKIFNLLKKIYRNFGLLFREAKLKEMFYLRKRLKLKSRKEERKKKKKKKEKKIRLTKITILLVIRYRRSLHT